MHALPACTGNVLTAGDAPAFALVLKKAGSRPSTHIAAPQASKEGACVCYVFCRPSPTFMCTGWSTEALTHCRYVNVSKSYLYRKSGKTSI